METKIIITDEVIEERLQDKGLNFDIDHDEALKVIQNHYDFELTDNWNGTPDYSIYAETTADGYEVWVATNGDGRNVCINEDVHYYDSCLSEKLVEAMVDYCELIYVDDLEAYYVEDAIMCAYQDLYEDKEQEITDELIDQGYEWPEKVEA